MNDEYQTYTCEYPFNGGRWGFTIQATSHEEAEARMKQMPWGKVNGRLVAVIPANEVTGLWVRLVCWFRNALGRVV